MHRLPAHSHKCAFTLPRARFLVLSRYARLPDGEIPPMRGTSGSVQRGPANPARPGREQRYRDRLVCRRSPEVPLIDSDSQRHSRLYPDPFNRLNRDRFEFSNAVMQHFLMSYQVIARKWRPQTFSDLVGQQHVTRTLAERDQAQIASRTRIFFPAREASAKPPRRAFWPRP